MRILLATDGSTSAVRARDLTARLPWPDGTTLRVVNAAEQPGIVAIPPTLVPTPGSIDEFAAGLRAKAERTLDEAEPALRAPGRTIERRVLRGRPSLALADEAATWEADLIVLGSRGDSRIASMLLGSTSAEVMDHAPCPVLIARDSQVDSVVFATDGSPSARLAESVLSEWPVFRSLPISVITAGEPTITIAEGMAPGVSDTILSAYVEEIEAARNEVMATAQATADRLVEAGLDAVPHVREGNPTREILAYALTRPHPLLLIGSRGLGRLARVVLGSVARNVLYHAPGSVLIVREGVIVRPHREVRGLVGAGAPTA